jgi:methylaspartate mutase sigma subunit
VDVTPPEKKTLRLPRRVVLGSTPSDAHTWNLVYLQLVLEEYGLLVENLGACLPVDTLLEACLRNLPDLIVLSTISGHGADEAVPLIEAIRAHDELSHTTVVIGGMLTTDGSQDSGIAVELLRRGFDGVYTGEDAVTDLRVLLTAIGARREVVRHAS